MNTATTRNYLLIIFALIGLVAVSIYPLSLRAKAESRNQAVTLAAEYDAIETLAAGSGVSTEAAMKLLKQKGINAVTISDENIGELINSGQITVKTISVADEATRSRVEVPALVLTDPAVLARVQRGMMARFGDRVGRLETRNDVLALPDIPISLIRGVSVGLPPEEVKTAREFGFKIIARAGNPPAASASYVKKTLEDLKSAGASFFLPSGDQVLGQRLAISTMVESLQQLGIPYVTAEFGKINGDLAAMTAEPTNVIRLHTAQLAELDKMTVDDAVDRFEKAARERDIRILLLRPIVGAAVSPLNEFGDFVDEVAAKVRGDGATISVAHGYEDLKPSGLYAVIQALASAFLFVALAEFFAVAAGIGSSRRIWIGAAAVVIALLGATHRGQELVTLLTTVLAPLAGFVLAEWGLRVWRERKMSTLAASGLGVLVASLSSFAGALYVAGTMVGVQYLIKLDEFSGIKIAVFLPIVLVGVYFLCRLSDFRATLANAITWGTVLMGVFLVAALAILISRTGNDGVGASGAEMVFRGLLDKYLYVRPRTKEFLIGHPAMWVGLGMLARYRHDRRFHGWIALLLAIGAVGQTGIVNTLCHGHIPFMLSIARIWLGLALGSVLGAILWVIVRAILPKPSPAG